MNKKGIVAKNIVEIIIAVLCVLLVLGIAQKAFGNQERKNVENLLDEILGIAENLEEGEEYKGTINGIGKQFLVGFSSDDKVTPKKCFFGSCICVCPEANSKSCQTEGICKPIDVKTLSVTSIYPAFDYYGEIHVSDVTYSCIPLILKFIQLNINKGPDSLEIRFNSKLRFSEHSPPACEVLSIKTVPHPPTRPVIVK